MSHSREVAPKGDGFDCLHCYFWKYDGVEPVEPGEEVVSGFCRRYPPVFVPQEAEELAVLGGTGVDNIGFPRTWEGDWCGEFVDGRAQEAGSLAPRRKCKPLTDLRDLKLHDPSSWIYYTAYEQEGKTKVTVVPRRQYLRVARLYGVKGIARSNEDFTVQTAWGFVRGYIVR